MSSFNETIEVIKKYLDTIESRESLAPKRDYFIKSLYEVERHFILMDQSDNKPDVIKEHIDDIKNCLEFLLALYPNVVITKNLYNFVTSYCLLISNWNNNLCQDREIDVYTTLISRIYSQHMTVVESFDILKTLIQRCERLQSFAIPSVELSKHYLESLDKKVEKNND